MNYSKVKLLEDNCAFLFSKIQELNEVIKTYVLGSTQLHEENTKLKFELDNANLEIQNLKKAALCFDGYRSKRKERKEKRLREQAEWWNK